MRLKNNIKRCLLNIPGWHTKRHLLVIESDDWGSIRMPSLDVYNKLLNRGVTFSKHGYEKVDTIASRDDLNALFEMCNSFRDINGNPLVITANAVVANPDFNRIRESEFQQYFYEPITTTMERYYPNANPFPLWEEGIRAKVFYPQLHGREHVNVAMWLNSLRSNHKGVRLAFENGVYSVLVSEKEDSRIKNTSAYYYKTVDELNGIKTSINEACSMFESLFGFKSQSFIAPSYKWDTQIEDVLNENRVRYIQGMISHSDRGKRKINYIGRKNAYGQIYLNRNAFFESSQEPQIDWVKDCLERISIAFSCYKPVTISMHRLNFIGALDKGNRVRNLKLLKMLITEIQSRWPDVEFLTSDQLGCIISSK